MANKVALYLFNKHIADIYQVDDRVYLRQFDKGAHLASFVSDSLPGSFGHEMLEIFFENNHSGKKPTIIDKLLFIGNRALEFRPQYDFDEETDTTLSLKALYEKAKVLKKGADFHSLHSAFLVSSHSFVGAARSKAVVSINLKTNEVSLGDRSKQLQKDLCLQS